MKRSKKPLISSLLVAWLVSGGLLTTTTTANASSYSAKRSNSVRLVWRKSMKKHIKYGTKGSLYSKHLGYRYASMEDYPTMNWKTVGHEKLVVKKTGKSRIYYHIVSLEGKVQGWVWRGYLKSGYTPVTSVRNKVIDSNDSKGGSYQ